MLALLGLVGGLAIGAVAKINNEALLGAGLLLTAIVPVLPPVVTLGILGVGVATIVKNIVSEKYKATIEELTKESNRVIIVGGGPERDIHEVAKEEAVAGFWSFTSTLTITALPLHLLAAVKGISACLMPASIIALVLKGYSFLRENPTKAIKSGLIVAGLSVLALTALNASLSGGVLVYFLSLVSIPSLVLGNKESTETSNTASTTVFNFNTFLYGGTGTASIVATAILLGQTILWGSGKDVLGSLLNNDASFLLDPYRLTIAGIVIGFLYLYAQFGLNAHIEDLTNSKVNKVDFNLVGNVIKVASVGYSLLAFNPLLVIGAITTGLILNTLDSDSIVRQASIPILLIAGIFSGI